MQHNRSTQTRMPPLQGGEALVERLETIFRLGNYSPKTIDSLFSKEAFNEKDLMKYIALKGRGFVPAMYVVENLKSRYDWLGITMIKTGMHGTDIDIMFKFGIIHHMTPDQLDAMVQKQLEDIAKAKAKLEAKAKAEAELEAKAKAKADAKAEVEPDADNETKTEVEVEADTKTKTKTDAKTNTDVETKTDVETNTDVESKTDAETQTEALVRKGKRKFEEEPSDEDPEPSTTAKRFKPCAIM